MDVSKIVLTDAEQRLLNRFRESESAELTIEEYRVLLRKGLIKDSIDGSSGWFNDLPKKGICFLSDTGKDLQAYQNQQDRIRRQSSRRYWITTGIAVAALLMSVASLLWQAYSWKDELKQNGSTSSFSSSVSVDSKSDEVPEAQTVEQPQMR